MNDNYQYARLVFLIGNKNELTEEKLPEIEAIVLDEAKARQVFDAAKTSMGACRPRNAGRPQRGRL